MSAKRSSDMMQYHLEQWISTNTLNPYKGIRFHMGNVIRVMRSVQSPGEFYEQSMYNIVKQARLFVLLGR